MENKELIEKIDSLEDEIKSLKKEIKRVNNQIYFDVSNLMVNILYPVSVYVTYLFFIQVIPNWFVNSYLTINQTAIIVSAIINTIIFCKMIIINTKLMFTKIFKKMYIKNM